MTMKPPSVATARPKRVSRSKPRPHAHPPAPPFRALIAYGDIPAARRAMTEIREVLGASGCESEFRPLLWRFDQLAKESWNDMSLRDAAASSVVVLASTETGLPAGLERWLGMLVARKDGRPMTIIAVLGGSEAWTISIEKPRQSSARKKAHDADACAGRHALAPTASVRAA